MNFDSLIEKYREDIIENVRKLVKIPSVEDVPKENMPFGEGPYKALEYVLDLGKDLGFNVKNYDGYAGQIEYGSGDKIVGVLSHVDTVEVGTGWTMEPYSAEICDGKLYGRGSYDDKGACIASIYALMALKEAGVQINKKIRLIFGANEETGMKDIPYYLTKEKEPDMAFSPDAPFPAVYGEKGIINFSVAKKCKELKKIKNIYAGSSVKYVPDECSIELSISTEELKMAEDILKNQTYDYKCLSLDNGIIKITIEGKTAFATKPWEGINAVSRMMNFLKHLDFIDEDIKEFVKFYNKKIGFETDGKSVDCNFEDDISTPLTLNVGTISLEKDSLTIGCHIRYPVKCEFKEIEKRLHENFSDENTIYKTNSFSPAHYVPKESELVKTLMEIYKKITGDTDSAPVTMDGGTYARTMKNAVAFGPLFPGEKQVAHGPDEYVNIESLIKACKIYATALYELSR